ncbi:MAG: hypothetical protein JXA33_08260 [Anaerolineae bacterium]|nr:hypothetical protein [Anaerolineae bacterium]
MNYSIFDNPYRNTTLVHNALFDHIMPTLSSDAWKVLCVALRHTWGWGRNVNRLDQAQFLEKTGIEDPTTLERAVEECLAMGYLLRRRIGQQTLYTLNMEFVLDTSHIDTELPPAPPKPVSAPAPPPASHSVSPTLTQALQILKDFAREMDTNPDPEQLETATRQNKISAIQAWIELGREMTHLPKSARFTTVLERLLAGVPPLPLSMLAPEIADVPPVETTTYQATVISPADLAPTSPPTATTPQSAEKLWETVLTALEPKMRSSQFKFLKPTRGLDLTASKLTVAAPNKRTKEWLETGQQAAVIQETFNEVTNGTFELAFIVE